MEQLLNGKCSDCGKPYSDCICENYKDRMCEVDNIRFELGQRVEIILLELYGFITTVILRPGNTSYEVSFFTNGEYCQRNFEEFELTEVV